MSTSNTSSMTAEQETHSENAHLKFIPVEPVLSSPVKAFLRLRRIARSAHNAEASHRIALRMTKRVRDRLATSAFNAHRVSQLDAHIKAIEAELKVVYAHIRDIGAVLIDLAPAIDEMTTMEQRLELLNCNHADRSRIDEPSIGMLLLMAAYCTEDSAAHRNDEWNDRPLHAAVNAEMHRVMLETPEGKAASDKLFDELFAPGGMFEKVPRYDRQPDGTMLRQAPPLVVHDTHGSRVVERKAAARDSPPPGGQPPLKF